MSAPETRKWGEEIGDTKTRREFLTLLASVGDDDQWTELPDLAGKGAESMFAIAIRAIALELVKTGCDLQEISEKVETVEAAGGVVGAFLGGVLGVSPPATEDGDDEALTPGEVDSLDDATQVRRFKLIVHRTGAIIRKSAGLPPSES